MSDVDKVNVEYDEGMRNLSSGKDPFKGMRGKKKSLDDVEVATDDTADHHLNENVGTENLGRVGPDDSEFIDTSNFN